MTGGELDQPYANDKFVLSSRQATGTTGSLMRVRGEWISFYDAQFHRVVRFIMRLGASLEAAEEAAQDAFLESWMLMDEHPDRWQAITNKDAWIRTVAVRRQRRPPGPRHRPQVAADELPDLPAIGPGHDELTVQAHMVLKALRRLDDQSRMVMAFDLDGFPTATIASQLGITEQRTRDVRKKARSALKQVLAENMASEGRQS
jgi:RNA polymerase sigma factor (sigma-70 family)